MHITLQKRDKGQTWASPISGESQLDPHTAHLEQKRLMLQRFQEEVKFTFVIFLCANYVSELQKSFGLQSIIWLISLAISFLLLLCCSVRKLYVRVAHFHPASLICFSIYTKFTASFHLPQKSNNCLSLIVKSQLTWIYSDCLFKMDKLVFKCLFVMDFLPTL